MPTRPSPRPARSGRPLFSVGRLPAAMVAVFVALTLVLFPRVSQPVAAAPIVGVPASDLRTSLNTLGEEHVYLAGAAIAAALGGRDAEFKIAAAAADQNTQELGKAVGSVYGPDAEKAFLALWRAHIGFFVDYTQGAAAKDSAKKAKAKADLDGYRRDIDAFLTGANPNLPKGAVAELFSHHVDHLTMAIDSFAGGDATAGYAMLKMAAGQTHEIMDPLAAAIVKQFPDKFAGTTASRAADLRAGLNDLGVEHVYLAGFALNAAIAGRNDEFKIAAAAADQNSVALSKAVGSVYGADAERAFLALWRAHIGFFADYATGAATGDQAKKDKARADLDGYRRDIDAFLTGANPNLPKGAVAQLFGAHVNHLSGVIDALVAKDATTAYSMLHMAAHQTQDIMDPLSDAIVKQFPDKFPTGGATAPAAQRPAPATALVAAPAPAAAPAMPAQLPRTGLAIPAPIVPDALIVIALLAGGAFVLRRRG